MTKPRYTASIGDIHGCLDQLKKLVAKIESEYKRGTIVFLGDYTDRGPDSKGVIDFLMAGPQKPKWKWVNLKGNHDYLFHVSIEEQRLKTGEHKHAQQTWITNGGIQTMRSYSAFMDWKQVPEAHLDWLKSLPMWRDDGHRVYVHAGLNPNVLIEHQHEDYFMWHRYRGSDPAFFPDRHVVHGHTIVEGNPQTFTDRTNVDSGCFKSGILSAAVFKDGKPGGPIDFLTVEGA